MSRRRQSEGSPQDDGFTLIEALVALAVVAAGVAAIGQLGYTTLSTVRRLESRLNLTSAAREIFATLGDARAGGAVSGEVDGAAWRLRTSSFPFDANGAPGSAVWAPQAVRLIVSAPGGGQVVVDTVRLQPIGAVR